MGVFTDVDIDVVALVISAAADTDGVVEVLS